MVVLFGCCYAYRRKVISEKKENPIIKIKNETNVKTKLEKDATAWKTYVLRLTGQDTHSPHDEDRIDQTLKQFEETEVKLEKLRTKMQRQREKMLAKSLAQSAAAAATASKKPSISKSKNITKADVHVLTPRPTKQPPPPPPSVRARLAVNPDDIEMVDLGEDLDADK